MPFNEKSKQNLVTNDGRGVPNAGRKVGSLSTKTILEKFLSVVQNKNNPLTGEFENLSIHQQMILKQIERALSNKKSSLQAFRELLDRLEGKVTQVTDMNIVSPIQISQLTNEQIKELDKKIEDEY